MAELDPRAAIERGIGGAPDPALVAIVGASAATEDAEVARLLVQYVAERARQKWRASGSAAAPAAPTTDPGLGDYSYLGRLSVDASSGLSPRIEDLTSEKSLLAIARGGSLRQRRAAIRRLGNLASAGAIKLDRAVLDALSARRDVDVTYEMVALRHAVAGVSRAERAEEERLREQFRELERLIVSYWDGQTQEEPIFALEAAARAEVLLRLRDASDLVVSHVGALVEGSDTLLVRTARRELIATLRHAADPRLVPALRAALFSGDSELIIDAARALARIDDPRIRESLVVVYERAYRADVKMVVAAALAEHGDPRGADFVRSTIRNLGGGSLAIALEAVSSVGGSDEAAIVASHLDDATPAVSTAALRALERIGTAREVRALLDYGRARGTRADLAATEEALEAIRARLELRGEETTEATGRVTYVDRKIAARTDPAWQRLRGHWDYAFGRFWLFLGAVRAAVARFELAASRRHWAAPWVAMALAFMRRGEVPRAVGAFRRAIEIDREFVESHPIAATRFADVFLRRAVEVEREGRADIARALIEEALAIDLRFVPPALRFELERRREVATLGDGAS